jgi:hypothetical protein
MALDGDERPLSEEEIEAVEQNAKERLRAWKKRTLYSMAAFFLNSTATAPFLAGHRLHAYWESIGKYLVLLSMALLPVLVCCLGLWGVHGALSPK